MAYRYLRASGNWDGPVWAATEAGAAGSAAPPTTSDTVVVQSTVSLSTTLTSDVAIDSIIIYYSTNWSLNLNKKKMFIKYNTDFSNIVSLNVSDSILSLGGSVTFPDQSKINFSGSTLLFDSIDTVSTIEAQNNSASSYLALNNLTLIAKGDYGLVNLPTYTSVNTLTVENQTNTGSSDGRGAVTIANQNDYTSGYLVLNRLILIGSSPTKRAQISAKYAATTSYVSINAGGTVYGTFAEIGTQYGAPLILTDNGVKARIGSNSIRRTSSTNWLLEDTPKISTLVDPLTTAPGSNTNWTVSGTLSKITTGKYGGGYSGSGWLTSTNTFDLLDSTFVFESVFNGDSLILNFGSYGFSGATLYGKYNKVYYSNGNLRLDSSSNGLTYSNIGSIPVSDVNLLRSFRLSFSLYNAAIGSINPTFNQAPTTILNTENNKIFRVKTPTLEFTGTDPDGNTIVYQVQIDTVNTFDSQGGA